MGKVYPAEVKNKAVAFDRLHDKTKTPMWVEIWVAPLLVIMFFAEHHPTS
jgi:hypothetical protein